MATNCRIGTSGWAYPHWRGVFYPAGLPQSRWFEHYASQFDTVEINNTFYQLPEATTFEQWARQAPPGFLYSVKANRFLTHVKRLKDCARPVEKFLSRVCCLGDHLGPILYQLPPRWRANPERLEEFAANLPADLLHVFEFRDESWFAEPVREVLTRHSLSFCIVSMPELQCPLWVAGPAVYIRFHGSGALYAGRYSREELAAWAATIHDMVGRGYDVYAYFNNDAWGHAVINARELRDMVEGILR